MLGQNNHGLRGPWPSLKGLIAVGEWQQILNNFSAIIDINIRTVDYKGIAVTPSTREPQLCTLLKPLYEDRFYADCIPTFLGGRGVVDKNLSFICPAGLHIFAAPLRLENRVLGYLILGPVVLIMRRQKEEYLKTAQEFGLDLDDLWSALLEIKVVSFHGMQSLVELIKDVGEYALKIAYQDKVKEKEKVISKLSESKLTTLLDALLDVAFEISQADIGSIMFLNKFHDELTIRASRGLDDEIARNARVKLGDGISGIAAVQGEPLLIDENTRDARIRSYLNRPYLSSSMVIPLKTEGRVIGVMNLGTLNTSNIRFNKDSMNLMHKLAAFATLAVHI